jgi:hypothetical protein
MTPGNILEDLNLQQYRCENLKSRTLFSIFSEHYA